MPYQTGTRHNFATPATHKSSMIQDRFAGSKIALICDGTLLTYKRDDKPSIPFPGYWDLPGGGREGEETAEECAMRELEEEFGITVDANRIEWSRRYEGERADGLAAYFFVAHLHANEIAAIRFGDEGQYWEMTPIEDFLANEQAVPQLKRRLQDYLNGPAQR